MSFHKFGEFFPGTGALDDVGYKCGGGGGGLGVTGAWVLGGASMVWGSCVYGGGGGLEPLMMWVSGV